MRTTPSGFQAKATCQGSSQKGPLGLPDNPARGTPPPSGHRAQGRAEAPHQAGRLGQDEAALPVQTPALRLDRRRKAGPRACPHTARGLGRSPGKGGGGDPIQQPALRLVHILEGRSCGGPLGKVASSQALAHLRGRQDNQKNKRVGNDAEGGARASQRPQQRRASSSTRGLSLHRSPR